MHRIRKWYKLPGLSPPTELGVYNANLDNGYRACAERYFTCKTSEGFQPALPVHRDEWINTPELCKFLDDVLGELTLAPVASTAEVVNAYTGPKRAAYARAEIAYLRDGLVEKDTFITMFQKKEKQPLGSAPRVINPRTQKANLVLGKYLKKNEKNYFNAIAAAMGQDMTVIKGIDIADQAVELVKLWNDVNSPVAVGGDAKKFDMHVSRAALEYEHLFYLLPYYDGNARACLEAYRVVQQQECPVCPTEEGFPELSWILARQLHNRGKAYFDDGSLEFDIEGTRASGDLNTSLGNCLLMCAMQSAWADRVAVPIKLANNGDDCVTFLESRQLDKWMSGQVDFYARLGFRMEIEAPVYEIEEAEFCQSRAVLIGGEYRMIRNPATLVTKASMCLQPITSFTHLRKWMMAVGTCEGHLSNGVPVLESFARALRRNGVRCSNKLVRSVSKDTSRTLCKEAPIGISSETRLSFFKAWGITPTQQLLLERHYDGWTLGDGYGERVMGWEAREKMLEPTAPVTLLLTRDN